MSATPKHATPSWRALVLLAVAILAGVAAGCGSTVQADSRLTVYVSVPLTGNGAKEGKAVAAGAKEALADAGGEAGGAPVDLELLDDADGTEWTQSSVAANARAATQDSTSIAYIGELLPDATRISVPITNEAGLLQVAPGPVDRSLLAEAGGNDVPSDVQTTGDRSVGALFESGGGAKIFPPAHDLGYESMAVILDSIDRAEDPLNRADVIAAFLATSDRDSELGTYTVAPDGLAAFTN